MDTLHSSPTSNTNILPDELWDIIFSFLKLNDLLKARSINKYMEVVVWNYIHDWQNGYMSIIRFYDYETYHLFDALMEDEMCYSRMKTDIGKFVMKYIIMRGAYYATVPYPKMCYTRFVHTRCLTFKEFRRLYPHEEEWVVLKCWGQYKHEKWSGLSISGKSIIKMECKFNIYVRLLYTKWCGTWIPIHISGNKKRKIDEIIFEEEKQPSRRIHQVSKEEAAFRNSRRLIDWERH